MSSFKKPPELDAHVVVYTTPMCPFCHMAKHLLNQRKVAFIEVTVAGDREARDWLHQASGQSTVPQIFIGDQSIGGFDELSTLDGTGELAPLLTAK